MREDSLLQCERWLQQGDLFEAVPCPVPHLAPGYVEISWSTELQPALLVMADCQIDKARTDRLLFCPALPLSQLDVSSQALARQDQLGPHHSLRIGVAGGVEYYCRLDQTFWVPVALFGVTEFHDLGDGDLPRRGLPDARRSGCLEPHTLTLLQDKLNAFWTGRVPRQPELFPHA